MTHHNVTCPKCRHCIRLNSRQYPADPHSPTITVPAGISLHCPTCHTPAPAGTRLTRWQPLAPYNRKGGDYIRT